MKKILTLTLCALSALALAGCCCGGKSQSKVECREKTECRKAECKKQAACQTGCCSENGAGKCAKPCKSECKSECKAK